MKKNKSIVNPVPNLISLLVGSSSALNEFCNGIKKVKGQSKKIFLQEPKDEFDLLMDCLIDF